MIRRLRILPAGLALLVVGCSAWEGTPDEGRVTLAEVNGQPITVADVDARLAGVSRLARPEYSGPIGRARMLEKMIEEEVLYLGAIEEGIDRDEDVRRRLDELRREVLVQEFLDRKRDEAARVSPEEARAFYEEHRDEYRTEKMLRVRMLLNSREVVVTRAREIVLEGLLRFKDACSKYSDDPLVIAASGLIPDWIRRGRAVPWIGNHPKFHEVVFALEPGEISEVFQTPKGYHVVRVVDVKEARERSFEEVEKDVVGRISRQRTTSGLPRLLADLRQRYRVKVFEPPGRSAEELFAQAQSASDPRQRLALYEELVERYPDDERALDAHFMIGFIRAEELHDPPGAEESFRRVVEIAPDSELAQSARWMLISGGKEAPSFEDDGPTAESEEVSP